jgi:DNA-binding NarL/FixJ family response regulator
MINIIIVDDHAVVRKGLIQILEEHSGLYSVDEASSGDELLEKVKTNHYDVIVLDISMQGRDGIDTLKSLKKQNINSKVLAFSMYPEDQYAIRLLKSGASGYLNKECAPEEFLKAVERVASGNKYVSPELAEILLKSIDVNDSPLHDSLSDREFQVMCMIAKGKSPTQIATDLNLSINTISTYRIRILEKLNLKNTAEVTHYAIKNRLVE